MSTNEPNMANIISDVNNPTPLEIKTETGQVFKALTTDELIAQMKKSIENGSSTIRDLNQRVTQTATELQQVRQQQAAQQQTQAPAAQTDDQIYWEKWQRSPIEAQRFLDSRRLGVPENQVDQVLQQSVQTSAASLQNHAGDEFMRRNPDFPASAEASNMLVQHMSQKYANRGPARDAAELADRLEITYGDLVRQGQLQPVEMEPVATERAPRIPSLGGNGGGPQQATSQDILRQAQTMPLDKLKEVIERGYQAQRNSR